MAVYTIQDTTLTAIADAIREKKSEVKETGVITHQISENGINLIEGHKYKLIITPTEVISPTGKIYIYYFQAYYISDNITFQEQVSVEIDFISPLSGLYSLSLVEADLNGTYTCFEINDKGEYVYNYKPTEMANAISELQLFPDSALNLTGDCQDMFRSNRWNWVIEQYGDKITTNKLSSVSYMFHGSTQLTEIPFALNLELSGSTTRKTVMTETFTNTDALQKFPQINIMGYGNTIRPIILDRCVNQEPNITLGDTINLVGFNYNAFRGYKGEEEPTWIFEKCDWEVARNDTSTFGTVFPLNWMNCFYIKTIPSMSKFYALGTGSYYHHWYPFNINNCYSLKEITLPRPGNATLTSSPSGFNFTGLITLKHFTFDIQEDGTPYTANWKNITLTLSNTGCGNSNSLQANKLVSNGEEYLLLKDDDEYWTNIWDYSGYNHDSAVETINSLPDTSAYGTNTIKFKGVSGSKTDGGAINTLTEEEIAVATAKGWTVSLV